MLDATATRYARLPGQLKRAPHKRGIVLIVIVKGEGRFRPARVRWLSYKNQTNKLLRLISRRGIRRDEGVNCTRLSQRFDFHRSLAPPVGKHRFMAKHQPTVFYGH